MWIGRVTLSFLLFCACQAGHASSVRLEPEEYWLAFRALNPLFIQDVTASSPDESGRRLLLLSEPPSRLRDMLESTLSRIFKDAYVEHQVFRHPIGYDGWVKDIVVTLLYPAERSDRFDRDIAVLHLELFGTDYKASYRILDPKAWTKKLPLRRQFGPPNLELNAASLHNWLFEERVELIERTVQADKPADVSGAVTSLDHIFKHGQSGVFSSKYGGLVLLVLDRDKPLEAERARLRQFFLDTDTIIGAIAPADQARKILAIIGRERDTSLAEMPPLRAETVLTLAATRELDLAQSYERNFPLADQTTDSELLRVRGLESRAPNLARVPAELRALLVRPSADWAPILLSHELTHTEYGNLLNVTDQILKGWSNSNRVTYGNFPYVAPLRYPHDLGVRALFPSAPRQLTYNWNTAGFGSWTRLGDYEVFSLSRTGSLPVSYLVDDANISADETWEAAFIRAEDAYWKFFSEYRDPSLSRAAQYAALHLIFRKYEVAAKREEPLLAAKSYEQRWSSLERHVTVALQAAPLRASYSRDEIVEELSQRNCMSAFKEPFIKTWEKNKLDLIGIIQRYPASSEFGLQAIAQTIVSRHSLRERIKPLLDRQRNLDKAIATFNADLMDCERAAEPPALDNDLFSEWKRQRRRLQPDGRAEIAPDQFLRKLPAKCSEVAFQKRRNRIESDEQDITAMETKIRSLNSDAKSLETVVEIFGDCTQAWRDVVAELEDYDAGFVKTPTIVVSSDRPNYGGHNLDGRSLRVILDPSVGTDDFRYDADAGTLRIHPKNASNAGSAARSLERQRTTYETGSDTRKARIQERAREALRQDRTIKPLRTAMIRGEESSSSRAFGATTTGDRQFVGWQRAELNSEQTSLLLGHASKNGAQIVVQMSGALYRVFNANGKPPYAVESATPGGFQRAIESTVDAVGRTEAAQNQTVVVISDGTMSTGDLAALQLTASTRQSSLSVNNYGGGGRKPPNVDSLSSSPVPDGPQPSFNFGKTTRQLLQVFARDRLSAREILERTDADWRAAKVTPPQILSTASYGLAISRLEIPFKRDGTSLRMQISAIFRRPATQDDANNLARVVNKSVLEDSLDSTIEARIAAIRADYASTVKDAELRFRLQESMQDFYVVELQIGIINRAFGRIFQ